MVSTGDYQARVSGVNDLERWLRLREWRGALYPESNVAQPTEYGVYGTKTPGEIAESRRSDGYDLEDEAKGDRGSVLGDRMREAEARDGRDRNERGLEPET